MKLLRDRRDSNLNTAERQFTVQYIFLCITCAVGYNLHVKEQNYTFASM